MPITVASGATFALENASGVVNPFSTEKGTNVIAGVLDLGGAAQSFSTAQSGNNTGSFRNGGEIRNGIVTFGTGDSHVFENTTFTFGMGVQMSGSSRFYLQDGAHFRIDGGAYTNLNSNNHVIGGTSGENKMATLEVSNGGRLVAQREWFVGHTASGALIGDGGIIDVGSNKIDLSNAAGVKSTLALTNSVLTCGNILFAYGTGNAISTQTLVLKNTLVNLSTFVFNRKADDSSILFDGATLVPRAAAATLLPSGLPTPQLGTGGLIISNAFNAGVAVGMAGAGGLVKMGDGALTVSANQSFTGDVVVSGGAFTSSSTFAGGLRATSGATLDVANATFGGNIAIATDVSLAATNGVNWATTKYVPIAKTTAGVSLPGGCDAEGRYFFAKRRDGITTLYYGKQRGLMIMVR